MMNISDYLYPVVLLPFQPPSILQHYYVLQADILLISTSSPNGLSYIETAELDGWVMDMSMKYY